MGYIGTEEQASGSLQRPARGHRRRGALAAISVTGLIAVFAFSAAWFSSEDETDFQELEAGTIVISTTETGNWTGNFGNLLPGAQVNSDITVENTGTAALVYAISGSATDDLAAPSEGDAGDFLAALRLQIAPGECDGNSFSGALLDSDVRLNDLGLIRGNTDPYTQAGDLYLAAGDDQDLCVRVAFVNDGDQNDLQAATAQLTLTFQATQIDADGSIASPAPAPTPGS
jgi:hypothetical protein